MPLDDKLIPRAAALDADWSALPAEAMLAEALSGGIGKVALVSSFGAESAVLLHMVALIDRATPVLFIDTGRLFAETLDYQRRLGAELGLTDLRRIGPDGAEVAAEDPDSTLAARDPQACCALRKVRPLERALEPFDAWITGRKRSQSNIRAALSAVEAETPTRLKLNPLWNWDREAVAAYMEAHALPRHPLVAQGFPSIGCAPCTTAVAPGEDARAGRWRGTDVTECGIHLIGGKLVRITRQPAVMLVTDDGARPDDWSGETVHVAHDADPESLGAHLDAPLVEIAFPAFNDGRGFSLARRLRADGYRGRLRAAGKLLPDQYAMARRVGFDEVAVDTALFQRQGGEAAWSTRADWQAHHHRARLAG